MPSRKRTTALPKNLEAYLDFGNRLIKWRIPGLDVEMDDFHAIHQLTDTEWRRATGRAGTPPPGHIKVNGIPYVVGKAALRHGLPERPKGAARYNELYYGVGVGYILAAGVGRTADRVTLFASHAPDDIEYANDLKAAARRNWDIEYGGEQMHFTVQDVYTFDEPLGGFNNFVLTNDGKVRARNPIKNDTVLVMDIGGYTTDVVAVDEQGVIDVTSMRSFRTGIIDMMETFERDFRANNHLLFKRTGNIDVRRMERAFKTGTFRGGGHEIDCRAEANEASNLLLNDLDTIFDSSGGVMNYDSVVLTGGGSILMREKLEEAYGAMTFHQSEPDATAAHFSNVRGGHKLFTMLKKMKVL